MASCGIVLVGTLYPMALEALTGDKISVGAPFFNSTVVWTFMLLLVVLPFGLFLPWKRGNLGEAAKLLSVAAIIAVIAGSAAIAFGANGKQGLGITLGAWVLAGSIWEVLWRARFLSAPLSETARRILNMRRGQFGSTLGHIGLAVTVIGIAGATAWNVERLAVMKIGDTIDLGSYQLTFKKVYERTGPNYAEFAGDFDLKSGGTLIGTITTSKRKYDAPPQVTTAAGISPRPVGDVYVVLGNEEKGAFSIRAYYHPFVRWIWSGALIMFLGGLVSLLDRRLRIGLPQRAAKAPFPSAPAPAE